MRTLITTAAAALALIGLGACSSASDSTEPVSDTTTTTAASQPMSKADAEQMIEDLPYLLNPFDDTDEAPAPTGLEQALDACKLKSGDPGVELGDDGYTLATTSVKGNNPDGMHPADGGLKCISEQIELPLRTQMKIEHSDAFDFDTTASWDEYTVSWALATDPVELSIVFTETPPTD